MATGQTTFKKAKIPFPALICDATTGRIYAGTPSDALPCKPIHPTNARIASILLCFNKFFFYLNFFLSLSGFFRKNNEILKHKLYEHSND
jgi:hypothetical protein